MKEILYNLALINTTDFCQANDIDCSGTHLVKYPHRQTYALCKDNGGAIVTVSFYKNQRPTHFVHELAKEYIN